MTNAVLVICDASTTLLFEKGFAETNLYGLKGSFRDSYGQTLNIS
jgi:hypothetical protein